MNVRRFSILLKKSELFYYNLPYCVKTMNFFQNLYGYAMSEKVPVDEIDFVENDIVTSWTTEDIMRMDSSGNHSYIFEVDIEIPQNIHDKTSDYPLCPEKLAITKDMISPKSWFVQTDF